MEDGVIGTAVEVGFPMLSKTELGERTLIAANIRSAPPGTTWRGFELEAGDVLLYAPEALHSAANPMGTAFAFAAFDIDQLARVADGAGLDLHLPEHGTVRRVHRSANTTRLARAVDRFVERDADSTTEVQMAVIGALADIGAPTRRRGPEPLDDTAIVARCIALAEHLRRVPTVAEATDAVFASDRRVRSAFQRTYGVSPTEFFRRWQLDRVRRQLLDPMGPSTVTQAASGAGLFHLGRLAQHYAGQFGELPSETLRNRSASG